MVTTTKLTISVDQKDAVVRSGGRLSGFVSVTFPNRSIEGVLVVRLVGKETAFIKPKTFLRSLKSRKGQERVIFQDELCVDIPEVEQASSKNANVFDFSFELPASLPPTMQLDAGDGGHCSVEYSITANLNKANAALCATVIKPSFHIANTPVFVKPKCFRLKRARAGGVAMVLGAKVDKNQVGKRQCVNVSLGCVNKSDLSIMRVEIRLLEVVAWTQNNQTQTRTIVLSEDGTVKLQGIMTTRGRGASHPPDGRTVLQDIAKAIAAPQNAIPVKIPAFARADCDGTLVQVSHSLEAVFVTRGRSSYPRFRIPIHVAEEHTVRRIVPGTSSKTLQKSVSFACSFRLPSVRSLASVEACSVY